MSWPFAPICVFFRDLVSDLLPTRAVIQSVLLRALFFVTSWTLLSVRPTNAVQCFLHPTSLHDHLPRHVSVFVCTRVILSFFAAYLGLALQRHSFLKLLTLMNCCPCVPIERSGLHQKHLLHVLRFTATCPSNSKANAAT